MNDAFRLRSMHYKFWNTVPIVEEDLFLSALYAQMKATKKPVTCIGAGFQYD